MRRAIIEIDTNENYQRLMGRSFETVEYFEILDTLKMDFRNRMKLQVIEIGLRPGVSIDEVELPRGCRILDVLESRGRAHTVLYRVDIPDNYQPFIARFEGDVIYETPHSFRPEKLVLTCIGSRENIQKVIEAMGHMGRVSRVSLSKAVYLEKKLLSILTGKQREALEAANKYGYYDHPRNVTLSDLSEKMGIGKSTLAEHIWRAEGKIVKHLLG